MATGFWQYFCWLANTVSEGGFLHDKQLWPKSLLVPLVLDGVRNRAPSVKPPLLGFARPSKNLKDHVVTNGTVGTKVIADPEECFQELVSENY